jgi:hypothetical protein
MVYELIYHVKVFHEETFRDDIYRDMMTRNQDKSQYAKVSSLKNGNLRLLAFVSIYMFRDHLDLGFNSSLDFGVKFRLCGGQERGLLCSSQSGKIWTRCEAWMDGWMMRLFV